jgi:ribonucleoside-diphosphate reductase alpha chain
MSSRHFRDVGVGLMGLAEALMSFHVRYGSPCAQQFAAATMSEIALACWELSFSAARAGHAKPEGWSRARARTIFRFRAEYADDVGLADHTSRWSALVRRVEDGEHPTNCNVTSVAPTGSIAQIAKWQMTRAAVASGDLRKKEITSGCEPAFDWGVYRQDSSGVDANYHDMWFDAEHNGKPWMVTAMNGVTPEEHARMQAAVCRFTCMSVSKTINLPNSATVEDVKASYELAWRLGIPGTSLYRDGSKPMQVLTALECPSGECAVKIPAEAAK